MIKKILQKFLVIEKIKSFYKEFFVLRVSLFYSLFILLDLIYYYHLKDFNLIYSYILNVIVLYAFLYILSFSRILFVFITFLIFIPTGLLVYFLMDNIIINADILAAIVNTSKQEAAPFILPFLIALLLSGIYYTVSIYHVIKYKNKRKFSVKKFMLGIVLVLPALKDLTISEMMTHHQASYPTKLYGLGWRAFDRLTINQKKANMSHLLKKGKLPITVVMYVGEAARGDHFSINGYHRNTTPLLTKNKEVLSFGITKSCSNITFKSLPCMLTSKTHNNSWEEFYTEQRIENVLQDKGFVTNYIGSNKAGYIDVNPKAEHDYFSRGLNNHNYLDMIKNLEKRLKQHQEQNSHFLFLRNQGSHFNYTVDYPPKMNIFLPIFKGATTNLLSSKKQLINSYDNSIYYTGFLISKVVESLSKEKKPVLFIYSSDHGESLGENFQFLHGNSTIENRMVELFVYVNEAYKKMYPKKYKALMINYKRYHNQLRHSVIWHSLLDGSGFENKDSKGPIKKELSLFSEKLKPQISKDWFKTDYQKN